MLPHEKGRTVGDAGPYKEISYCSTQGERDVEGDSCIAHCRGGSIRDAPLRIEGRTVGDAGPYKEIRILCIVEKKEKRRQRK